MPAVWTTPRDWANGELVDETDFDEQIRDNMLWIKGVLAGTVSEPIVLASTLTVGGVLGAQAGIEVGTSGAGNGFIDLHNSGGHADYDVRLSATGGTSGAAGLGTLTIDGKIAATDGQHIFGTPTGDLVAPVDTEAALFLYRGTANNWAGWGVDGPGNAWLRTGTAGTPNPALVVTLDQLVRVGGTPSTSIPPFAHADDPDTGFNWAVGDTLQSIVGGSVRLSITTSQATFSNLSAGVIAKGTGAPGMIVDRLSSDGVVIEYRRDAAVVGSHNVTAGVMNFVTAVNAHLTQLGPSQTAPPVGAVVIAAGQLLASDYTYWIQRFEADPTRLQELGTEDRLTTLPEGVTFSAPAAGTQNVYIRRRRPPAQMTADWAVITRPGREGLPRVASTTTPNDPRVYGVWMGKVADDSYGYQFGQADAPMYNVAGSGLFWCLVTDIGGDIAAGDFLTTSSVRFCGMKQADDILHSYTVAKAVEAVSWATVPVHPTFGVKVRRIACSILAS